MSQPKDETECVEVCPVNVHSGKECPEHLQCSHSQVLVEQEKWICSFTMPKCQKNKDPKFTFDSEGKFKLMHRFILSRDRTALTREELCCNCCYFQNKRITLINILFSK